MKRITADDGVTWNFLNYLCDRKQWTSQYGLEQRFLNYLCDRKPNSDQ